MNRNTKRINVLLASLIALTLGYSISARVSQATVVAPSISDLAWMAGRWQTAPGGRAQIEEHWMAPAGGTMLGMGRTIAGARTVEFEFLKLEQRADAIYYVASPNGLCPATDFKLTRLSAREVVFENPAHDFPKRISYRKNADGSLTATVDGGVGTKAQTFNYLPIAVKRSTKEH
jgi:hypothetical protein